MQGHYAFSNLDNLETEKNYNEQFNKWTLENTNVLYLTHYGS